MSDKYDGETYHHAECGTHLRVLNAVLEDRTTWCPGCKEWFTASPETLEVKNAA